MTANMLFLCLCGLAILALVSCQECQAGQPLPVYVNVSDNATFHIQVNQFQFVHRIHLYRMMESRSRIATVSFPSGDWNSTYVTKNGIKYRDRILTATVNVTTGLRIIYLTIADIQPDDNGTYMIQPRFDWFPIGVNETCFKLYVLGLPEVSTSMSPYVVLEGSSGNFKCLTTSTTAPPSHNLTIFASWFIDGRYIETSNRYRVENNMLTIYSMIRTDDGLAVTCEAREEKGLTTLSNISVIINWGPDPVLILQPSRSFYHIDVGKTLPSIKCSADCKPVCNISWTSAEKGSVVSTNGLLSPGPVTEENSGEYLCTASKEGTYKQASKSIFILLKQKKENVSEKDSEAMAAIGIGLSVAALLLAVVVVIVLFRQRFCTCECHRVTGKESTAEDSASQNRAYEDLKGTRVVRETYAALALGTFDDSPTRDQDTRNVGVYENNRLH